MFDSIFTDLFEALITVLVVNFHAIILVRLIVIILKIIPITATVTLEMDLVFVYDSVLVKAIIVLMIRLTKVFSVHRFTIVQYVALIFVMVTCNVVLSSRPTFVVIWSHIIVLLL